MSFGDSIKTVLTEKYATFSGRARRSEYWWFYLAMMILNWVLTLILLPRNYFTQIQDGTYHVGGGFAVLILVSLALFIPGLAVAVRRLHDTGKSGLYLFMGLIPFIGWIFVLIALVTEGTRGPNQYGPDPKA